MKNDRKRVKKNIPFKRAMIWILISTLFVSGTTAFAVLYYFHVKELQIQDGRFRIVAINQIGSEQGALSSQYLSELLNLSVDRMTNIYQFNSEEGRNKLLSNPLIKTAEIKKSIPGTLCIKYTLRKPVAYLSDFTNTFIDEEGVLLPIEPFFTPKELPEIFLGDLGDRIEWGDQLESERCKKALALLKMVAEEWRDDTILVKKIDLSRAEFPSYGMREIVATIEEKTDQHHRILRLN
nr:Cell division protein FtsQ [Chlamydiota bacterium]